MFCCEVHRVHRFRGELKTRSWYKLLTRHGTVMSYAKNHPAFWRLGQWDHCDLKLMPTGGILAP